MRRRFYVDHGDRHARIPNPNPVRHLTRIITAATMRRDKDRQMVLFGLRDASTHDLPGHANSTGLIATPPLLREVVHSLTLHKATSLISPDALDATSAIQSATQTRSQRTGHPSALLWQCLPHAQFEPPCTRHPRTHYRPRPTERKPLPLQIPASTPTPCRTNIPRAPVTSPRTVLSAVPLCYNALMSQAPHRVPPPPQPTPDNPFELQPVQPPAQERDLTSEILTISVIVACLVLLGVGAMLWVRDNRPARPRPTATASQPAQAIASPTATATASHTAVARPTRTSASVTPATRTAQGTPSPSLALPLVTGRSGTPSAATSPSAVHLPAVSSDDRKPPRPRPRRCPRRPRL